MHLAHVSGPCEENFVNTNCDFLMVMDVTQEDVIEYCGTWYGSNHGGLPAMFVDPKHIVDGSDS